MPTLPRRHSLLVCLTVAGLIVVAAASARANTPSPPRFNCSMLQNACESNAALRLAAKDVEWEPQPLTPELRSVILPGWGQRSLGNRIKGSTFTASFVGAIVAAAAFGIQASDTYDEYQQATTAEDAVRLRKRTQRYNEYQNIAIAFGGTIWVVNVADILWNSPETESPR